MEAEFSLNPIIKLLPAILSLFGASLAIFIDHIQPQILINLTFTPLPWQIQQLKDHQNKLGSANYNFGKAPSKIGKSIYTFLNGKYFLDAIITYTISKEIDRGARELLGPYELSNYLNNTGKNLAKLYTGIITTYSLYL